MASMLLHATCSGVSPWRIRALRGTLLFCGNPGLQGSHAAGCRGGSAGLRRAATQPVFQEHLISGSRQALGHPRLFGPAPVPERRGSRRGSNRPPALAIRRALGSGRRNKQGARLRRLAGEAERAVHGHGFALAAAGAPRSPRLRIPQVLPLGTRVHGHQRVEGAMCGDFEAAEPDGFTIQEPSGLPNPAVLRFRSQRSCRTRLFYD